MTPRLLRPVHVLLAALALLAASCGGGGNRAEAIENLTSGPDALTQDQAECVVDEIGEDKLADYDNFSQEFQDEMEEEFGDDPSQLGEAMGEMGELVGVLFSCLLADGFGEMAEGLQEMGEGIAEMGEGIADGFEVSSEPVDCSTADVDGPCDYGDDAELDALWDACEGGNGAACDDLFFDSPFGSRYEQFGDTCGDREDPGHASCEETYGAG